MDKELDRIKSEKWFYEFSLPDGTKTETYLPESAKKIHVTREKVLRRYLGEAGESYSSALDISCHEGFFSLVLSDYLKYVTGVDKNIESLERARLITKCVGRPEINFCNSSVESLGGEFCADFVLCFGLLYHVENPVQIIRKLADLTKKAVCIETQIFPHDFTGSIEDGSYLWQRELQGMFGLCVDYSGRPEGGLTDLALVPSRYALGFLLKQFGFKKIDFYEPESDDYEQFTRNQRVIVFAEK